MTKRPLALLISLFLTGCSLAPDYQRPAAPIPAGYDTSSASTIAAVKATDWQQAFTDPALQKLDADDRAALAGLLQSRLAQVLPAPAEALDTFARLQITLIGAVVREAITLPPPQAQRLLAQFKRGLVVPDFG